MTAQDAFVPAPYQYVTLRCIPRVDRGELVNVGVVVYCQQADYLAMASDLDPVRLRAIDPSIDVDAVREALRAIEAVCTADPRSGAADEPSIGRRFGHLSAPRSTVVQPGPVHSGRTSPELADGPALLAHLLSRLVTPPGSIQAGDA